MFMPISGKKYLTVCLNPVIQKTLVFDNLSRGDVNRTARYRTDVAGKGILATRVLTQLGERAVHLTQLGGPTRDWFLALCREDALDVRWVESESAIRFCTTLIESDGRHATELVEEAEPVAPVAHNQILGLFGELLAQIDAVLLSGTVASGFRPGIMGEMARTAAAGGRRLYLDIKGKDLEAGLTFHPVCVKPNFDELLATLGLPKPPAGDESAPKTIVERAGRDYYDRFGAYLVVTRGSRSTLYWDGAFLGEVPVQPIQPVNPIGSGDSFGVGLAVALENGLSLEAAVREGTRLGALNAQGLKPGSIVIQD